MKMLYFAGEFIFAILFVLVLLALGHMLRTGLEESEWDNTE